MTNSPKNLSILSFGDSLTEGYSMYGLKFTPYGSVTEAVLRDGLEKVSALAVEVVGNGDDDAEGGIASENVKVRIEGVSGELVTRGMVGRMRRIYENLPPSESFSWLIFLGGTNDLGWGKGVNGIWAAIREVIDIAREGEREKGNEIKVLLCTVPECGVKKESLDRKRNELNGLIKGDESNDIYIFDLHQRIKYHDMPDDERELIWDDGLHFTEEGYERIGVMVGERLLRIIRDGEGRRDCGI